MTEIRRIQLPEKDQPLRADVSLLGSLVGEMLVDQHGEELLARVEAVRKAAIRRREGFVDVASLEAALAALEADQLKRVIQAFATYLRAVNLAEKVHRIRRQREHERSVADVGRDSLEAVLAELRDTGVTAQQAAAAIGSLRIRPVFTAHPTEATRRTIQEKEYDILLRLVERLNPGLTPAEERLALERIRTAITSAWQTRLVPHVRPTVADELDNILFYLGDILYRVAPVFHEKLRDAFAAQFGACPDGFPPQEVLRFGSWVGGDMDGNPNVTAATLLETLAQQRNVVIRRYLSEVRHLGRYLSQSTSEISVSLAVTERLQRYRDRMPEAARSIPERHRDMPYRCLLEMVGWRLRATLEGGTTAYSAAEEFAEDIECVRDSLRANKGKHAGLSGVERLYRRVRTFGFHLVTLDVRQDALQHRRVLGELLGCPDWGERGAGRRADILAHLLATDSLPEISDPAGLSAEAVATLAVFRAISTARQLYGGAAIGLFIVSMTQGADDVLTAMALAAMASPHSGAALSLDVAPLLETVDDLEAGPGILEALLGYEVYRSHLADQGQRQVIMVGYSDSNKDGGIVASRWALHQAQRLLVETGRRQDVQVAFFHGRGGTVSRGGGNLVNGIMGAPPGSVGGYLRVTEQGEVINQKYGVRFLALRNLELVTGATLRHSLGRILAELDEDESRILQRMAEVSRERYRQLVYYDPDFPGFFRSMTPIDVIERLNIGSRPASRRGGEGIENLRAIPWVFSWAQVRVGLPGVFGFGAALEITIKEYGLEKLRNIMNKSIFFQSILDDVEMVLGKSDLEIGCRYAALADANSRRFFMAIKDEFERTTHHLLEVKQQLRLLDDQPVLQRNIHLRNPYVDPLHLLQVDLLHRWREGGRTDPGLLSALQATVNGIALGIQNTG